MADCHRALGQPQQALKLAQSPSVRNFAAPAKAEMTLVESGARRDLGQLDAALRVLEQAPLNAKNREAWVVRLRYAYADTLEAAGRREDALEWFHRAHAIDADELTDAAAARRHTGAGARALIRGGVARRDPRGDWARSPALGHNGTTSSQRHHVRVDRSRPLGKAYLDAGARRRPK